MNKRWLMLVTAVQFAACIQPPVASEMPAVIDNPDAAGRAELLATVRKALGDVAVTLADNALTESNVLLIERVPRRNASGLLLNGRDLGRPQGFHLYLSGAHCVLKQDGTDRNWVLQRSKCKP